MKLDLTEAQRTSLHMFLDNSEDAERMSEQEYVVDLYNIEQPITLDLTFFHGGVMVEGAAELKYDEEQDGWYMGDRIETPRTILSALKHAGALDI